MIVFSPLALYTTYLGWQQYDVLYDALSQTGLLYIGFFKVAINYLIDVLAPAGSTHNAAEHALNQFLFNLIANVLICILFVFPSAPLEQKGLSFKPMCTMQKEAKVSESTIKDSGTTYDETFADVLSDAVKMPIGFAVVQNLFSSFTYGAMKVTGCSDSLQAIQGDLISTYIPHQLREDALAFHRQCYSEAKSSYMNESHTSAEHSQIKKILERYGGEEDLNWLGSKTYQTFYYDKLRAREPVRGFSYEKYPNPNFETAAKTDTTINTHRPENGYPTCNQWWHQIQSNLVKASEKAGYLDKHIGKMDVNNRVIEYQAKHQLGWNSDITSEEYIAKVLIQSNSDLQTRASEALIDSTNSSVETSVSRRLVNIGQSFKSYTTTPLKREATLQTLPVMHAFFYFFLILFAPLVMSFSGNSPRALGSLCSLFMMTIFMPCIWHYVAFLERAIVDPLGDDNSVASMRNMALLFYYIAPFLLLKLSSHFGGDAGVGLAGLMDSSKDHTNKVAEAGSSVAKTGVRVATGGRV